MQLVTKLKETDMIRPFWQTFVFFSRSSSVIFRVPPLPLRLIPLPSLLQFGVLIIGLFESSKSIFTSLFDPAYAIGACAVLIALEGLFGGTAYVNAYLRVGLIEDDETALDKGAILARKEFRMACVGFADTLGILAAR
jgi:battenin